MDVDAMVLDLADEDYVGLWELVWRARTVLGNDSAQATPAALRPVVSRLLGDGCLALFRGAQFAGDERPVRADEVPAVLEAAHSWEPPSAGDLHIRVVASAAPESPAASGG